jgi:hypothetical protein
VGKPALAGADKASKSLPVLYLFSGKQRQIDVKSCLRRHCDLASRKVEITEIDYNQYGADHDMTNEQVWAWLKAKLVSPCHFDMVLMTPPCSTWTRLRHANWRGLAMAPLRDSSHPWGFPWLEGSRLRLAQAGNILVERCIQIIDILAD